MSGATLAPNPAIQIGASGSFVYVVNADSTVAVRKVTTGPSDGKNTVIASGLTAGENVVIDGVDRLRDGAKVVVRNGGGASTGAPAGAPVRVRNAPRTRAGPRPKPARLQRLRLPSPSPTATP